MFNSPFPQAFPSTPFSYQNKPVQKPVPKSQKENKFVTFGADLGGCWHYRRGFLHNHINMGGLGDATSLTKMIFEKDWYRDVTCITLQRQASAHQKQFFEYLKSIQKECGFKLIYEVDDVVFREDIPEYNAYKHSFDNDEIRQNCIDMINMSDEVTVTCKFMRELYRKRTGKHEISVIPNFMPYWWIGHQYDYKSIINNFDSHKKKPRIVYSGSGAHFDAKNLNNGRDDFSEILKFVIDNRTKYQFVFIGAFPPPLAQYVKNGEIEFHPWKSLLEYPGFLSKLNPQLFLAPLEDNNFNRAKSDIKYIEAAQLGIPCLCQDMVTYENAISELKFKTVEELEEKVDKILNWKNRSKYYQMIPRLREIGSERFLEIERNYNTFLECFKTDYGDHSRKLMRIWND